MLDIKLNRKRLGMHWHYYRVRYLLFLVLALAGSNFLLSATSPKTPPDRKVDVFIVGAENASQTAIWQKSLLSLLPPGQREVSLIFTPLVQGQENAVFQLMAARMAAQEGSIWILPGEFFTSYAEQKAFRELDQEISSFDLPEGIDLSKCKAQDGHLYGIPLDKSTGLATLLYDPTGLVLAFPAYTNVNYENARTVANYFVSRSGTVPEYPSPADTGFGFYVASSYFGSTDTSAWSSAIKARLNMVPGVFLVPYAMGRETLVAEQMKERMKNYPSGMCVVPQGVFTALARQGALMPLDDVAYLLKLTEGADLAPGRETAIGKDNKSGPEKLYGIPLDNCTALSPIINPRGMMLAFPVQPGEALSSAIDAANAVLEEAK